MKRIFPIALTTLSLAAIFCSADEAVPSTVTAPTQSTPAQTTEQVVPPSTFLNLKLDEMTTYGLNKLTPEERASLQTWVKKYSDTKSKEIQLPDPIKLQAIHKDSKTVELADGRKFSVSSSFKKSVANWNIGDFIRVEPGKKKNTFVLFHVPSNKSVKVKLCDEKHCSTEK